uniref:Copine I n=1 Tax=Trepomonas sp. PC1 TaxID=1076344 RepID=A0A146K7I4_9EUKA|eukprot:JAP91556.1 Copine I [Trepomonas sp. PC1]
MQPVIASNVIMDKFQTFAELEQAQKKVGIESIQMVVGFDFSKSNEWTGEHSYRQSLHALSPANPYLKALSVLQPLLHKFDEDGIIPAFRFGCAQTRDQAVLPLLPSNPDPHFKGFDALKQAYAQATQEIQMSGPTTFAPMIQKAIEVCQSYGGRQLIFLLLLTDGDVSNPQLDMQCLVQASSFPISICALGLGDGPFDKMNVFDNMPGRKFDNFQFVNFTALEAQAARCECPDLVLATHALQELPDQFMQMRALGIV